MMNTKKTEILSARLTQETKQLLEEYAEKKEWSIAHAVEYILRVYLEENYRKEEKSTDNCTKYTFLCRKRPTGRFFYA